jgi:hypothetical protein
MRSDLAELAAVVEIGSRTYVRFWQFAAAAWIGASPHSLNAFRRA